MFAASLSTIVAGRSATLPELGSACYRHREGLVALKQGVVMVGSVKVSEVTAGLEKVRSSQPARSRAQAEPNRLINVLRKASPKSAASVHRRRMPG